MKKFLLLALFVLPLKAFADCNTENFTTRILEADGTERVVQEKKTYCQDSTKTVFDECEMFQWKHKWGTGTSVSCNWSENQAMQTALTHAPDGFKIEWYDVKNNTKGYTVVSWSRPLSNAGWCREVVKAKYYNGSVNKLSYTMCYGNEKWYVYKGY